MSVIAEQRHTGWMGERACAEAARAEDAALAFDEMFTRYHGRIYGYLLGMVGDAEQAQDLTQDTFLKAYKALPTTRDLVLPAWLYRIATNTALDALRHRRRLTWLPFAPDDEERYAAPGADLPTRCAEREAVGAALARLTPPQRACLLLRARDGLSVAETAHALGLSPANVKVTLSRAKERFRTAYNLDSGGGLVFLRGAALQRTVPTGTAGILPAYRCRQDAGGSLRCPVDATSNKTP